jgi:long-chain acyl-CoA synthetase
MAAAKLKRDNAQKEIDAVNATLGNFEAIKKFALLSREWTVEGGELSPKLSLKR